MGNTLGKLKLFFILVFVIVAGWLWFDHVYNTIPRKECEEGGGWWSRDLHACKKPVSIREYEGPKPLPLDSLVPTLPESANLPRPKSKAEEAAEKKR